MIYKQYKSKDLIGKYFPSKNGEIVQLSVQSRPNTYLKIQEEGLPAKFYKIGTGLSCNTNQIIIRFPRLREFYFSQLS